MTDPVLEEGKGSVSLTCTSESNPPARISWSKVGEESSQQYAEVLKFAPVTRKDAGTYTCLAENTVGKSAEEHADVDVLCRCMPGPSGSTDPGIADGPSILSTEPGSELAVLVGRKAVLGCIAEGNPEPGYEWVQLTQTGQVIGRADTAHLQIEGVGYADQGEYVCTATNTIGGKKRKTRSVAVRLEVEGVPQVMPRSGDITGVLGPQWLLMMTLPDMLVPDWLKMQCQIMIRYYDYTRRKTFSKKV